VLGPLSGGSTKPGPLDPDFYSACLACPIECAAYTSFFYSLNQKMNISLEKINYLKYKSIL
jgi:hypothetical protein